MRSITDSKTIRSLFLAVALLASGCGSNTGDDAGDGDGDTGDGDAGDGDTGDGDTGDGDTGDGDTGDGDTGDGDTGDGDTGDGDTGDGDTGDGDTGDGDTGDGDDDKPMSVCDDNSFPPAAALVSDLEDGMVTGWDIYASTAADAEMGAKLTAPARGSFDDEPESAEGGGGDPATTKSVHFAGTGWASYGAGINFNLEGCKDLSEYKGVRFWAKGSTKPGAEQTMPPNLKENTLNFRVITAGSHAIIMVDGMNVGGDCDASKQPNKCFLPPQKDITLSAEWTKYEILFDDLKTPAGANPGSEFDGTNAMLLGWHSSNADFDVSLDEVEFY